MRKGVLGFVLLSVVISCYGEEKKSANDSVYKYVSGKSYTADILRCAGQSDISCVLDKAEEALRDRSKRLSAEADSQAIATGRKRGEDSTPSILMDTISSLVSEISDVLFKGGLTGFFRDGKEDDGKDNALEESEESEESDDDEDEDDDDEALVKSASDRKARVGSSKRPEDAESRGKKKKKKLKTAIKLLVLGAVLFFKITLLLKILAAHLQIKFLIIAALSLLINAARFWLDLKKGHNAQPQKVIYYEHAQHQHHYENEDEWGGAGGSPGGHGGYWSRKGDKDEEDKTAQDLAYAQQKPTGGVFSRVDDTPSFTSWF